MSTIPTRFEVYMTIECQVIAFLSASTSRDFLTLTFYILTSNSCSPWRVKFEDPTPISSWFMSHNVSRWLPLRIRTQPLHMRRITWPVSKKGKVFPYSLPSVGSGADPGVQAGSPQVTWSESRHIPSSSLPLLSAKPAFTLVALTRWRYL